MSASAAIEESVNAAGKTFRAHPIAVGGAVVVFVVLLAGARKPSGSRPGQMSDALKGQLIQGDIAEHQIDAQESIANTQAKAGLAAVRAQVQGSIRTAGIEGSTARYLARTDAKSQKTLASIAANLERYLTNKTLTFEKWSQQSGQEFQARQNSADRSFQEKLQAMMYDYQKSADYWIAYNERKLVPLQLQNSAYIARQQREAMVAPYTSATGVLGGVGGVIGNIARLVGSFYGGEFGGFGGGGGGGGSGGMTNQQAGAWIPGGWPLGR